MRTHQKIIILFLLLSTIPNMASAQNEGFGKQDVVTGMQRADYFFDARFVSAQKRMYVSSSAIALTIPSNYPTL